MILISDGNPLKTKDGMYRLLNDWVFDHQDFKGVLVVPAKFKCDLASIPNYCFWWKRGAWDIAAIAHDFVYVNGFILREIHQGAKVLDCYLEYMDKSQADLLFYQVCLAVGVKPITAKLMFFAVKLFGRGVWHK